MQRAVRGVAAAGGALWPRAACRAALRLARAPLGAAAAAALTVAAAAISCDGAALVRGRARRRARDRSGVGADAVRRGGGC